MDVHDSSDLSTLFWMNRFHASKPTLKKLSTIASMLSRKQGSAQKTILPKDYTTPFDVDMIGDFPAET